MLDDKVYPLRALCGEWTSLLEKAGKVKHDLFGQYAKEAHKFFNGSHDFMWKDEYANAEQGGFLEGGNRSGFPNFKMTHNRVFEAVALYGPSMYHRNPNIQVIPKLPPEFSPEELGLDPQDEMQAQISQAVMMEQAAATGDIKVRAKLKQHYLNWLQQETDKKTHIRRAVDEAVIKGAGYLWTNVFRPPSSSFHHPQSTFVSCDDILKDPDARYREDVQWIARKCCHAVNLVERKYGYEEGYLKGTLQSLQSQATFQGQSDKQEKRDTGTHDLIEYWEVYSKNGMGQRLKATNKQPQKSNVDLTQYGNYCYLAIAKDFPFPLNMPPQRMGVAENGQHAAQWPIPYWHDEGCGNGWPFAELGFYEDPDSVWPISLVKPGIGELRFINWCMSFLADKVAANCTSYVGVLKSAAKEIEEQLLNKRGPFKTIELSSTSGATKISELISFIQAPDFSKDIWTMLEAVMVQFDKRTGMTELLYGMQPTQDRSAEATRIKNQNTQIRPDEMASKVEDFASQVAMKEMECLVYTGSLESVEPVLGKLGARLFQEKVLAVPFERAVMEFDYRVEAGSARKPNKAAKKEELTTLAQTIAPVLSQFAMGGQFGPWNALAADLAEAHDLDPQAYLIQEQPVEPQAGPDPEAMLQLKQQETDMKMQAAQQKSEMDMQKTQADIEATQQKLQMELAAKQMELQLKAQEGQQNMQLKKAEFQQDSAMQAQEHSQQMEIQQAGASQDMRLKEQQAQSGVVQSMAKNKIAVEESKTKQKVMQQQAKAKPKAKKK
jgi:hypothetical protein